MTKSKMFTVLDVDDLRLKLPTTLEHMKLDENYPMFLK